MQKQAYLHDSRSYLRPRSSLLEVPCHPSISCSFHSFVPSPDPVVFWLWGSNDPRNDIWRTKPFGLLLKIVLKSYAQQNLFSLRYHRSVQGTPPTKHRRNGRSQRRLEHPPGSNTRVCLDFVSMTFFQQRRATWLKFIRLVLFLHLSPKVHEGGGGENTVFNAVEAAPAGSEPPAADNSM